MVPDRARDDALGALQSEHRRAPIGRRELVGLAAPIAIVGAVGTLIVALFAATPSPIPGIVLAIVIATFGAVCALTAWTLARVRSAYDDSLALCERGVWVTAQGRTRSIAYDQIAELRTELTVERRTRDSYVDRHRVRLRDGTATELRCAYRDNQVVYGYLCRSTSRLVADVAATLDAGAEVALGPLAISRAGVRGEARRHDPRPDGPGIRFGFETIAWGSIDSIGIVIDRDADDASADLVVRGGGLSIEVPVSAVPNAHVVVALAFQRAPAVRAIGWVP